MNTKLKVITPLSLTLQAVGFLALAVVELRAPQLIDKFIYRVLLLALSSNSILNLLSFVFQPKKRMARTLITAVLSLAALLAVWRFPFILGGGAGIAFGLWAVINAVVRLGYAVQLKLTHSKGAFSCAAEGIVMLLFGLALVTEPLTHLPRINRVLGIYFIFLSLTLAGDAVREFFRWDFDGRHFRRRIRIKPPVLLTAFLPTRMMEQINRLLKTEQLESYSQINAPDGVERGQLEVFFHMGKDVAMGFGHVDFCFEDSFYSYGVYDASSSRFFGLLCDGVLAVSPREEYIRFSTQAEKKTLVGFEMYLTEGQEEKMRQALSKMIKSCTPWKPEAKESIEPLSAQDFEVRAQTRFFKFTQGPYQTYNTVRTNCVALAEMLVSATGLPLLQNNGIITPGTYLSYMERQFARRNSIVVKKTVYKAREN